MGMTNGEAIEALYTIRAYYASLTAGYPKGKDCKGIGDVMCSEIANSCLMAIKALKQEPCEDCVSRSEVLKAINFEDVWLHNAKSHNSNTKIAFDGLYGRVLHLQSVKPQYTEAEIQKMQEMEQAEIEKAYELGKAEQAKKGRWEPRGDKTLSPYRCSVCGTVKFIDSRYCPECGANMEEG